MKKHKPRRERKKLPDDPNTRYEWVITALRNTSRATIALKKSADAQMRSAIRVEQMTKTIVGLTVLVAVLTLVSAVAVVISFLRGV